MKVALFGGTGFVGSYITDELVRGGHNPRLLVRPGSEGKVSSPDACETVSGAIEEEGTAEETIHGTDAVIYCIGILREFPRKGITFEALHFEGARSAIRAAEAAGVKRFILMSANGVKPDGTGYQSTKYMADEFLRASTLDWTVFRPSVIFGEPRGRKEFCSALRDQLIRLPLPAPLFFNGLLPIDAGKFELSPIHIGDVAEISIKSLGMEATYGKIYELGGPKRFSWKAVLKTIAAAIGKKKWIVPAPALGIKLAAALFDRFSFFPVTRDQITMLMEGNSCDSSAAFELFGVEPTQLSHDTLSYLLAD